MNISLLALRLKSNENDGVSIGKRGMGPIEEEHHLNKGGGGKGKIVVKAYVSNKCSA